VFTHIVLGSGSVRFLYAVTILYFIPLGRFHDDSIGPPLFFLFFSLVLTKEKIKVCALDADL